MREGRIQKKRALRGIAGLSFALALTATFTIAHAASQCPNPKPGYPALSFGMTGTDPKSCKQQLDRGRWLGFTSVTISPAFFLNKNGTFTAKTSTRELDQCLDQAAKLGYDVIYKPMVEIQAPDPKPTLGPTGRNMTLENFEILGGMGRTDAPWRAEYDFSPAGSFQTTAIDPFMKWLESKQFKGSGLNASVVVATELHDSLIEHPKQWNNLMWNLRKEAAASGLKNRVQIGIDPSVFGKEGYLPSRLTHPLSKQSCDDYQNMLWTADFFSPSLYGDYIAAGFNKNPAQSVHALEDHSESAWETALRSRGCKLSRSTIDRYKNADYAGRDQGRSARRSWAGEIGFGGSLARSYASLKTDPPKYDGSDPSYQEKIQEYKIAHFRPDQSDFVKTAPSWVKAVLDSSRGSYQETVSFWITGRFDIFGFSDFPSLGALNSKEGQYTSRDPVRGPDAIPAVAQIRDMTQAYTRERCPGWEPALPPKPKPRRRRVVRRRRKHVIEKNASCADCFIVTAPATDPIPLLHSDLNELIDELQE